MKQSFAATKLWSLAVFTLTAGAGFAGENSFLGSWALHLPGNVPGWLGVESNGVELHASMLWGSGSVFPLGSASLKDGNLIMTRVIESDGTTPNGKTVKIKTLETITATVDGENLKLSSRVPNSFGKGYSGTEFTGKRLPPLPPPPDLSRLKLGTPVHLFNGTSLEGWKLTDEKAVNGWGVRDGILFNNAPQPEGRPRKKFGNLRTVAEYEDFFLHAETRLPKNGNSGIYLRGIYEVQVYDSYGKPLDSHNMGAIYSRIKPTANAEKPAGEWQALDITFADRHVTVILNDVKIIDNQPVPGPTGGALWPEVDRPGPIYLQGDHTSIEYRNLVLKPVVK